jgi:hypothetical protein
MKSEEYLLCTCPDKFLKIIIQRTRQLRRESLSQYESIRFKTTAEIMVLH